MDEDEWCGLKIKENSYVLVNQFHGNFRFKTLSCRQIKSVFRDVKWCFNAAGGLKGQNDFMKYPSIIYAIKAQYVFRWSMNVLFCPNNFIENIVYHLVHKPDIVLHFDDVFSNIDNTFSKLANVLKPTFLSSVACHNNNSIVLVTHYTF